MILKKIIIVPIIICITTTVNSQLVNGGINDFKRSGSLNKIIKQLGADSLCFYYNNRYQRVLPECASIVRITIFDIAAYIFRGEFVDYYPDANQALVGNYINGMKEGIFQFYYPNGQLEKTEKYLNDKKTGLWEYYYENGSKHQVLEFKEREINILEYWNEKGKHLVDSGNGEWSGYETTDKSRRVSGKVANGKRVGLWKRDIPYMDFTMNLENFVNGKFTN